MPGDYLDGIDFGDQLTERLTQPLKEQIAELDETLERLRSRRRPGSPPLPPTTFEAD